MMTIPARETFMRSAVNQTEAVDHSIAVVVGLVSLEVRKQEMCQCVTTECSFVGKPLV